METIEIQEVSDENLEKGFKFIIPIEIIPNNMGINLCAVNNLEVRRKENGEIVSVTINFNK